jgi:signal transduction histidine kinase
MGSGAMSIHLLLPTVSMLLNLGLMGVVLYRPTRFPGRSAFVVFLLTIIAWSGAQLAMGFSPTAGSALAWHKLLLVAAMVYVPTYLRFTYMFAGRMPDRRVMTVAYSASLVGVGLTLSGSMVTAMVPGPAGFVPRASIAFIALMPALYGMGLIGLSNLWHTMVHSPSATVRNRARYLVLGSVSVIVLGTVDLASTLGFTSLFLSPGGNALFGLLGTLALVNDRVIDLRQVLRRQAAHLLMVPIIGGATLTFITTADAILDVSPHRLVVAIVTVTVFAVISPFVHQRAHRWVDAAWYGKRVRALRALRSFGAQVRGVHDMQLLSATMVYIVREATTAQHVSLLERVPRRSMLRSAAAVGTSQDIEIPLTEDGALAKLLLESERVLSTDELQESPAWMSVPKAQQKKLLRSGTELIVPIAFNGNVAGVLLLGPRSDGRSYPQEETELLLEITQEVAPSIENARLYEELNGQLRELQETQAQLLQAGKLATLGTLASGVAHEISNPLFSILGRVELLQRDSKQHLRTPKAVEYVGVIQDMSQRISEVVNALLTFSRRDSSRGPVEVNGLISDTLGLVERDLALSRVVVNRDFDSTAPFTTGNPAKLKQALMNVILNARDAMPGGGAVTLSTRQDRDSVYITCRDTGNGVSERDLSRIFDAFYTTKDRGHGAGLGLYICHSIIDEHEGHIEISSSMGAGTTVTISLPLEKMQSLPKSPAIHVGSEEDHQIIGTPVMAMPVHQVGGNK